MPKKKCEYHGKEHEKNSVYMFYNTRYGVHLYTNADGFDQVMIQFDKCDFRNREDWKIFLECANQPTRGKNARKAR